MLAQAGARAADLSSRVRFLEFNISSFGEEEGFDLIAMLNMPPFFDRVVALLSFRFNFSCFLGNSL